MNEFAIVAIGYNRPDSMSRLLNSLSKADYCGDTIPLIISIDNSGKDDTYSVAEKFNWKHGEKIIKTYPERLGLRNHVLECGNLTKQYENIAVFEDDIYVSEYFYRFTKQAIDLYGNDDRIAGIALYSHHWDQNSGRPFQPLVDKHDVYFMQYACSWGQVWSRDKWQSFIEWYKVNDGEILSSPDLPQNVSRWGDNSWLKYHIKYCIETNRFFVYPRTALSTNFSDTGQHNSEESNGYQVPIQTDFKRDYILPGFEDSRVKYDAFFELVNIGENLQIKDDDICVDLYGTKANRQKKRYWLTLESADYGVVKSFGMAMRPVEMNIIENIEGNIIKLYDTEIKVKTAKTKTNLLKLKTGYDVKSMSYRILFKYSVMKIIERVKEKVESNFC